MLINILLVWGITELILGGIIAVKKDLLILKKIIKSFSYINTEFHIENLEDIKGFSKWIGEVVLVEGAVYIFLSSVAIYFNMSSIIVIIFICIIEVVFFNIIMKGIQTSIKK